MEEDLDFGEAIYIDTVHYNPTLLVCESKSAPGCFRFYAKKKSSKLANGTETFYYYCRQCDDHDETHVARVVVRNNRVVADPDSGHNAQCVPLCRAAVEALKLKREIVMKVKREYLSPRQAYRQGLADLTVRFADQPELRQSIELAIPPFKSMRSSLYRGLRETTKAISGDAEKSAVSNNDDEDDLSIKKSVSLMMSQKKSKKNVNPKNGLKSKKSRLNFFPRIRKSISGNSIISNEISSKPSTASFGNSSFSTALSGIISANYSSSNLFNSPKTSTTSQSVNNDFVMKELKSIKIEQRSFQRAILARMKRIERKIDLVRTSRQHSNLIQNSAANNVSTTEYMNEILRTFYCSSVSTSLEPLIGQQERCLWMGCDIKDLINAFHAEYGSNENFDSLLALRMWGNRNLYFWHVSNSTKPFKDRFPMHRKDPGGVTLFFDLIKRWRMRRQIAFEKLIGNFSSQEFLNEYESQFNVNWENALLSEEISKITQAGSDAYKSSNRIPYAWYYELLEKGYKPTDDWTPDREIVPWEKEEIDRYQVVVHVTERSESIDQFQRMSFKVYKNFKEETDRREFENSTFKTNIVSLKSEYIQKY